MLLSVGLLVGLVLPDVGGFRLVLARNGHARGPGWRHFGRICKPLPGLVRLMDHEPTQAPSSPSPRPPQGVCPCARVRLLQLQYPPAYCPCWPRGLRHSARVLGDSSPWCMSSSLARACYLSEGFRSRGGRRPPVIRPRQATARPHRPQADQLTVQFENGLSALLDGLKSRSGTGTRSW